MYDGRNLLCISIHLWCFKIKVSFFWQNYLVFSQLHSQLIMKCDSVCLYTAEAEDSLINGAGLYFALCNLCVNQILWMDLWCRFMKSRRQSSVVLSVDVHLTDASEPWVLDNAIILPFSSLRYFLSFICTGYFWIIDPLVCVKYQYSRLVNETESSACVKSLDFVHGFCLLFACLSVCLPVHMSVCLPVHSVYVFTAEGCCLASLYTLNVSAHLQIWSSVCLCQPFWLHIEPSVQTGCFKNTTHQIWNCYFFWFWLVE